MSELKTKISIIVPVYNNLRGLQSCLASLSALADSDYEVIVVDDASDVDLRTACDAARVTYVRLPDNAGPGVARNEGAARATGTILAFIDADCTAPPDWLARIRAAMTDPSVLAVAGTYAGVHVQGLASEVRFLEASYYHRHDRTYVNAFVSANFAIRTDVYRKVRGFPPIRFGEDLLLGYKLKHAGVEVLWLPDLCVGQYFRPNLLQYFRQQVNWSRGASTIAAFYPYAMALKWNVRRGALQAQLALQGLSLMGAGAGVWVPAAWWVAELAALGCLGVNVPFIRFVSRQKGLMRAVQALLVVLLVRNMAHLLGLGLSMVSHPVVTAKGLSFGLRRALGADAGTTEPWEHIGNDFPPTSAWRRLVADRAKK